MDEDHEALLAHAREKLALPEVMGGWRGLRPDFIVRSSDLIMPAGRERKLKKPDFIIDPTSTPESPYDREKAVARAAEGMWRFGKPEPLGLTKVQRRRWFRRC